ncbi:MAG TPA: tail protein X [Lysobacter sp.]
MRVHARQGDTLDQLCWRHLGRTAGVFEAALELNPSLAAIGPVLPHGIAIELPEPAEAKPAERALIQLWS